MMRFLRCVVAWLLCAAALAMPFRVRAWYLNLVAAAVHAPYAWFGRLSRWLLERLGLANPYAGIDSWD